MKIEITRRLLAEIALAGSGFDGLGGFYLAYDLLGGKRGPLRLLARSASYIVLFFIGYVVLLGLGYALVASIGMGILLTAEFRLLPVSAARLHRFDRVAFGVLRGVVLGLAAMTVAGVRFGLLFGLLTGAILSVSFLAGFSPSDDYETNFRLRVSRRKALAAALRALIVGVAGVITAALISPNQGSLLLGLKLGLAAGTVSALVGTFSPLVEWWIENLPERRLGAIGLGLIILGLLLQSLQYWVVIWDLPVL